MLIDAHNHLQDSRFDGQRERIVAEMKSVGISGCIVNGTSEADWPAVQILAEEFPNFVHPAFGLHPWKIAERSPHWLTTLREFLMTHPRASLGECGLDRWMSAPLFNEQKIAFQAQLDLALELSRPVTIHCLKAWGAMMDHLSAMPERPNLMLHSFNGSLEVARALTAMGAYFSFSGYFLHERKKSQLEIFKQLPIDRILVETDAPDMIPPENLLQFSHSELNHPANLAQISTKLLEKTKLTDSQLIKNTKTLFRIS